MPGRFEVLGHQPLVIVDGAHNPPGADSCAQVFFDDFDPAGRRILVVGMPARPRPEGDAVGACAPTSSTPCYTCTAPSPRGMPSAELAAAARALGCDEVIECARRPSRQPASTAMRSAPAPTTRSWSPAVALRRRRRTATRAVGTCANRAGCLSRRQTLTSGGFRTRHEPDGQVAGSVIGHV